MSSEVPEGWHSAALGDVIRLEYGRALSASTREPGPIPVYGSNGVCGQHSAALVNKRGIVVGRKGTAGSVTVTTGPFWPIDTTYFVVPRVEADFDWLAATLEHARLSELNEATGVPGLNRDKAYLQPILLPPLNEQRRIAEVLRVAGAACEAGQQVVATYGDIIQTEIDYVVADLISDPRTPMARLGDVSTVKGGKRLPKGSEYCDIPTGSRYVRVTDWNDYEIDPAYVRWISSEAASSIRRYTISSADLFISIAGSIGLVASVPAELNGAYLTENAAKIVLREDVAIDREYLLLVLRSASLTNQIRQQKGVGGGVPKLALFRIEALEIPLPPLGRQREIAASYRSLKVARSIASQASSGAARVFETLAADLLSGRVRAPA